MTPVNLEQSKLAHFYKKSIKNHENHPSFAVFFDNVGTVRLN